MENLKKQAIDSFNNKNYKKSLEIFLTILKKEPKSIDILMFTANNYMQIKNYENALIYLEKLIQLNQKLPQIYYNRGICLNMLGKTQDAIDNFKEALSLKNNFFESYIQLGQLLKKENLLDDALSIYKSALTNVIQKDLINVNISEIYYIKKNYQLSKKFAEEALNLNPKNYFAMINIANCFMELGEVDKGIIELEKAKKINNSFPMIYNNLGFCYKVLGNNEKAAANYQKAIKLNPNLHDAYFNLSHIQLSENNFKDGWNNYEYRWGTQKKFTQRLIFNKPQWEEGLGFEKILIWGEQGIGEQLLFSSILPDVKTKFKKVLVYVEDKLVKLFQKQYNNMEFYPLSKKIDENEFDYHLPMCSLARIFRNGIDSFHNNQITVQENFNKTKSPKEKLRCALSWKSTNQDLGNVKSITLEDLKEILLIDQIDFFNIQYTNEDKEVEDFKNNYNVKINKNKTLDTFNNLFELSEFIKTCDFVISVSNTNAHLSASIGKPTFLLLPKSKGKFWYWENDKNEKNLWYPSIVKFKQEEQGDWSKPINNLKNFLFQRYF